MQLIVAPIIFFLQLYVILGFRQAIIQFFKIPRKWPVIFSWIILLFLVMFPLLIALQTMTGNIRNLFIFRYNLQLLDYVLLFPYWWALVLTVATLPYYLLADLFKLIFRTRKKIGKINIYNVLSAAKIIIFVFMAIYTGIRIYIDTYFIRLNEKQVVIKDLPAALDGTRIVLIGDIQIDRFTNGRKARILQEKLKTLSADYIMFSGDLVTGGQYFIDRGLDIICETGQIRHRLACLGDHDHWSNPGEIIDGMKECGWHFLEDSHYLLQIDGHRLLVSGVTNIYSRRISEAELNNFLSTAPPADLKILLTHQPSPTSVEIAARHEYQLFLAGHTHGGQLQFKPFGLTITPSMLETPYYSGLFQNRQLKIMVTNGIGLTFAPIRYQVPAEINILTLSRYPIR
jgi:predicted MPP superfamily phosphohydrolase